MFPYLDQINTGKKPKGLTYAIYALVALLLSVANALFIEFIEIGGLTPDLLLILVVWIALSEGQFVGLFFGFGIGILFDLTTNDVIGTNALAKTVVAFIAGYFYKEGKQEQTIGSVRFLFTVFIASVFHNIIYFFFYIKVSEMDYWSLFTQYGIAISLYTTIMSVFGMLLMIPRREINR